MIQIKFIFLIDINMNINMKFLSAYKQFSFTVYTWKFYGNVTTTKVSDNNDSDKNILYCN